MKKFALIGAAGFVAPRHLRAIKETGNALLAAFDPKDSVGVIDSYFPEADFFTEFERFDRHLEKCKRGSQGIDYLSVCSPNYLHDAHIRFGLRLGADVICEKPLVLNPWNAEALLEMEKETGKHIFTILQLRLHPVIQALQKQVSAEPGDKIHDIELTYITSRGKWYYASWKGEVSKSGGIATNIGVHFFDMLIWIFGAVKENIVHLHTHDRASGVLHLERARVRWFLSINADTLPEEAIKTNQRTWRQLTMDGRSVEFSEGFTDLHNLSYQAILEGQGFGIEATLPAIQLTHDIRNTHPVGLTDHYHPFAALPIRPHPFEHEDS